MTLAPRQISPRSLSPYPLDGLPVKDKLRIFSTQRGREPAHRLASRETRATPAEIEDFPELYALRPKHAPQ